MECALIVSRGEINFFIEMLNAVSCNQIVTTHSGGEARRRFMEKNFDIVIINAPLLDESGESLARHIASKGVCQVMLVVKSEFFDAVSAVCEEDGVLTIAKPTSKAIFWSALKLAKASQSRLKIMRAENRSLKQKIEDIRIIDRAKCLLISYLNMSESEAHRYIEKQAMDMRQTKRVISEGILKTYDNNEK